MAQLVELLVARRLWLGRATRNDEAREDRILLIAIYVFDVVGTIRVAGRDDTRIPVQGQGWGEGW